jgi:hypothetical protein
MANQLLRVRDTPPVGKPWAHRLGVNYSWSPGHMYGEGSRALFFSVLPRLPMYLMQLFYSFSLLLDGQSQQRAATLPAALLRPT